MEMQLQWLPFWDFVRSMLLKGYMPVWCPHFYLGFPLCAYPPTNLYFPPFFLLLKLSYFYAVYLENIFGFSIAGIFGYLLFRRMGLSQISSLAGMLAYVGSNYFCYYSTYAMITRTGWYLLLVYSLVGMIYTPLKLGDILLYSLIIGMAMSGDLEQMIYILIFFAGWVLYSSPYKEKLKRFFVFSISSGFGIIMGFCPVVNLLGYGPHSIRARGVSFSVYSANSFPANALISFLSPIKLPYIGDIYPFYIGWSVILLAILGIKKLKSRAIPGVFGIFIYGLYVFGNPYLLRITYHLPILNKAILHYSSIIVVFGIVAGFCAWGMEYITQGSFSRRFLFLVFILASLISFLEAFRIKQWQLPLLFLQGQSLFISWLKALAVHWFRAVWILIFGLTILTFAFKWKKENSSRWVPKFMLIFLILDLCLTSFPDRPKEPKQRFQPYDPALKILANNKLERFFVMNEKYIEDTEINPLMGMRLDPLLPGTHSPFGYWRVPLQRVADLINLIAPGYIVQDEKKKLVATNQTFPLHQRHFSKEAERILSFLNVGTIFARGFEPEGFESFKREKIFDLTVLRNPHPLPRVFVVNKLIPIAEEEEGLRMIKEGSFVPETTALVNADLKINPSSLIPSLELIMSRPGFWNFELRPSKEESDKSVMVLIMESYYPGWRAFEDGGKELKVERVNHNFIGIPVSMEKKKIKLVFYPYAFRLGIWTMFSAYSLWFFLLICTLLKKPRK